MLEQSIAMGESSKVENGVKVTFICKRYYTGKDVVVHRFGRLYEFPVQLARLGHHVTVICLDYRGSDRQEGFVEQLGAGSVAWIIVSIRRILTMEFRHFYRSISTSNPDVVIGSSDIPSLWIARRLAKHFDINYIVDLYDNYESFGQARIPGFRNLLKISVRGATSVICVSEALASKVSGEYQPASSPIVMRNGINTSNFFPGDRCVSRRVLGLPSADSKLIGTAGNLSRAKGLDTVYEAWSKIESLRTDVYLVLAGPIEKDFPVPSGERVIYLGELSEARVGDLFRSLDVGVVPAHDSEFGRYCFPQKLYEMVACRLPVVGAKVGSIEAVFKSTQEMLYGPADADSLATAILRQLEKAELSGIIAIEWSALVEGVEPMIRKMVL